MIIATFAFAVFSAALLVFLKIKGIIPSMLTCISVSVCGMGLSTFAGLIPGLHVSDVIGLAASLGVILTVSVIMMQMNSRITFRMSL